MRTAVLLALVACAVDDMPPATDDDVPDDELVDAPDPADDPADMPVVAPLALEPGCTAHGTLGGHDTWIFFARPDRPCAGTPPGMDRHAIDELVRLIRSVPAGGRIDGHIFSISIDGVAKALLDAQTRGVDVVISADGAVGASSDSAIGYLDQLAHHVYCGTARNTACISTADGAISHTKLFVFSSATAPDGAVASGVVWLGSANQTYASGTRLYNNTVTIYGDTQLYDQLRGYLDDLFHQRRRADYYDPASGRGHLLADAADVYASPEAQTDLVVHRLDDIEPDHTCRIAVMQASVRDSRLDVVDELAKLAAGGCRIEVVAHTVAPAALHALHAAHIPVRRMPIHDKAFIVDAKIGGKRQLRVFTGSHNLSGGSAHRFDEIFVKLAAETAASHPIYDAYLRHFSDAFDSGTKL